ncbi:LysR family transcriptional regulator [Roseateles cellulosilyticus]|uniref:LysR family transcriptional regulator n=1 Tax=Pelomonas cellulosilytica TaxID=2906762 RepID=A0ABS8XQ54_9BURK|nr:LysR family transcriptional regulator [Pelomonas sp. P8]MCE4553958.1 LysR family transcriptional regulator [Pelomonas sp. P8]
MKEPTSTGLDRLELMQTFVRIVEAGSLSAAAAQLGSTQPTVSRRLQWLEKRLGLRLLQRSTHAMRLTEDGERCYAHAKALLESWAAVEADLRGAQQQPRGHLRVLAPHAFGQEVLVAPLARFLAAHPEVSVDWLLEDREANFIAEGIDCAIRVGDVQDPSLVAVRLAEVPRVLVAPPGLWGAGEPPRTPADLAALPWVTLPRFYRDELDLHQPGTTRREHVRLTPRLRTDSLYAARSAVRAGVGAALLSAWLVADDLASGRLCQLVPGWEASPLPVYLLYPYARLYPARLRVFADVMRQAMPDMAGMRPPRAG